MEVDGKKMQRCSRSRRGVLVWLIGARFRYLGTVLAFFFPETLTTALPNLAPAVSLLE